MSKFFMMKSMPNTSPLVSRVKTPFYRRALPYYINDQASISEEIDRIKNSVNFLKNTKFTVIENNEEVTVPIWGGWNAATVRRLREFNNQSLGNDRASTYTLGGYHTCPSTLVDPDCPPIDLYSWPSPIEGSGFRPFEVCPVFIIDSEAAHLVAGWTTDRFSGDIGKRGNFSWDNCNRLIGYRTTEDLRIAYSQKRARTKARGHARCDYTEAFVLYNASHVKGLEVEYPLTSRAIEALAQNLQLLNNCKTLYYDVQNPVSALYIIYKTKTTTAWYEMPEEILRKIVKVIKHGNHTNAFLCMYDGLTELTPEAEDIIREINTFVENDMARTHAVDSTPPASVIDANVICAAEPSACVAGGTLEQCAATPAISGMSGCNLI